MANEPRSASRKKEGARSDPTPIWTTLITTVGGIVIAIIGAGYFGARAGADAGETAGAKAGETRVEELTGVPAGAVSFFNLVQCPSGWTEKSTARGRYLIGLDPSNRDDLGKGQGESLRNLENRAVGNHTHVDRSYMVGGVAHTAEDAIAWQPDLTAGPANRRMIVPVEGGGQPPDSSEEIRNSVRGTNAPYLQLLVCEKDSS